MNFSIIQAKYIKDYMIEITFQDGSSGIADLSSYPDKNTVFRKFLEKKYFLDFRIEFGTLVWGNGELDIAPEHLYLIVTGINPLLECEQEAM